jgi:uncharacterized protein (TIGR02145 family)
VPTETDWNELNNYLGGTAGGIANSKLRTSGTQYWASPNTNATNESGYSALPGGLRNLNGVFGQITSVGYWWTSTENLFDPNLAMVRVLSTSNGGSLNDSYEKTTGFSIRCIED